ncbi:MAG: TolC family protein [Agathobaculum sp.]|uniref:TolC family protein n=1 Tax=Agathobaculum sp. TaxID=2048138 RepID=UPI003D8E0105
MKRMCTGMLLACMLLTAGVIPAGAAQLNDSTAESFLKNAGVREVTAAQPEGSGQGTSAVQQAGFTGIERTVRANNPTVKALQRTLSGIENTDIEGQFFGQYLQYEGQLKNYQAQVQGYQNTIAALNAAITPDLDEATKGALQAQLTAAKANLAVSQAGVAAANAALGALDDAEEDAQEKLDDTVATYKRQFANVENQLVVGAQTAYLGIIAIDRGLDTLERNLAMLDRNIETVSRQYEIGMASQLTLDNLKQTRRTAAAQQDTLLKQQNAAEKQLGLLLGKAADTAVTPSAVPAVTDKQLQDMDYDKDLQAALKNSYSIWSKQDALREASNDYEDDVTSTLDAYEAAKLNLEAEKDNVTNSFRALYDDVQDKRRLENEAALALQTQQKNFDAATVQYQRGMISRNAYLDAQDELAAKQDALDTARLDLFTAYNTYDWATRGFMSGAA